MRSLKRRDYRYLCRGDQLLLTMLIGQVHIYYLE